MRPLDRRVRRILARKDGLWRGSIAPRDDDHNRENALKDGYPEFG